MFDPLVKVVFSPMVNIQSVVYKHSAIFHYDHHGRMIKDDKKWEKKKFKQRWWTILSLSTKRKHSSMVVIVKYSTVLIHHRLNVYHWRKYNFYQRRYDVYFVDNSGIYEHHCLNFLSIDTFFGISPKWLINVWLRTTVFQFTCSKS
jgi:hypothetical protein